MHKNCYSALLLTAGLIAFPGCAAMNTMKMAASETVSSFRPTTGDYHDPTDDSSDPWVQEVGVEARGHQTKEQANDPLGLRNVFMSQKARDIESNLGFE
ncbi:MAG: hypothetical protein KDA93_11805 [Planctomycetaceae bacterium]|nr:hypothetical protein [Planctomycetaceae bacterium]